MSVVLKGLALILSIIIVGCQGLPSRKPPIHLNPNMDNQPKYRQQAKSEFFVNASAMRMPVEGTVARGDLKEDTQYYQGIDHESGDTVKVSPIPVTMSGLERGRERYNIYCSVCHDESGKGQGIVVLKGFLPPPDFHTDLVRNFSDGHIFNVISNGIRNMPSYRHQISVEDRWLIVNYVRALQRSQNAELADIPEQMRSKVGK